MPLATLTARIPMRSMNKVPVLHLAALGAIALLASPTYADTGDSSEAILRSMSQKLAAAQVLVVEARRTIDPALVPGDVVKEAADVRVVVKRPASIHAQATDAVSTRHLLFDGKKLSIVDETELGTFYATAELDAGSVDALADAMIERFGFQPLLAEFFSEDPFALFMDGVKSARRVGEEEIGGVACHRLELVQEGLRAELWIGTGDSLPRRVAITLEELGENPQIVADMNRWELDKDLGEIAFSYEAPEQSIEIGIVPASAEESSR
jgi:hypothetical protein